MVELLVKLLEGRALNTAWKHVETWGVEVGLGGVSGTGCGSRILCGVWGREGLWSCLTSCWRVSARRQIGVGIRQR